MEITGATVNIISNEVNIRFISSMFFSALYMESLREKKFVKDVIFLFESTE